MKCILPHTPPQAEPARLCSVYRSTKIFNTFETSAPSSYSNRKHLVIHRAFPLDQTPCSNTLSTSYCPLHCLAAQNASAFTSKHNAMNSTLWKGTDRGAPISAHVTTLTDKNFTKMVQMLAGLENMQQNESEGLPLVLIIIIKKHFCHCAMFIQLQVAYSSPHKEEQKSDPLKNILISVVVLNKGRGKHLTFLPPLLFTEPVRRAE